MNLTISHVHIETTEALLISSHPVYGWDNLKKLEQPKLGAFSDISSVT